MPFADPSAPRRRTYSQVDVFTATPLLGNPLAVVHDGTGLDDERMARFARWTNLSETTFLVPPTNPEADYRVRIFTPGGELPFAGHPTLGSCRVWLAAGGQPRDGRRIVQECGIGLVPIRRDLDDAGLQAGARPAAPERAGASPWGADNAASRTGSSRLAFAAPPVRFERPEAELVQKVCAALGLEAGRVRDATWMHNGPRQLTLLLDDAATVLALEPDHSALKSLAKVGVVGPHPEGSACRYEVRFFAAAIGIDEDPVTGSLNAKIAQWLIDSGRAPKRYVAAQGTAMGRAGRVYVERDDTGTWIGGDVAECISGTVLL
ncbi:MAG TPA: PhzF family phenazine biosynthesis protein [Burkholderiaceae bacterium]|jgi:predicted PhzF superfamily epimerase YddE/YHI9|nr:PhzF family phenazine biosynthesis protein [Burkholderiaceae bacterium]